MADLTPAFSADHEWLEVLRNPYVLGGPHLMGCTSKTKLIQRPYDFLVRSTSMSREAITSIETRTATVWVGGWDPIPLHPPMVYKILN